MCHARSRCPYRGGDACDHWYFEEADKEFATVVPAVLARIGQFAHPDTRAGSQGQFRLGTPHLDFVAALDCQAQSAFVWLRSARTREGYTAICLHALTAARIETLKRRYC